MEMPNMFTHRRLALAALGLVFAATAGWAQPLGTFKWQLQPYCNVVSLYVINEGGNYTLDGTDDLCGATQKASVRGLAFLNPDGTIGFGLSLVTAGGNPVHINATITLPGLSGTWADSTGQSGTFTF